MPSDACVERSQSALRTQSERNQAQSERNRNAIRRNQSAIRLTARRFSASSSAVRAFTCKGGKGAVMSTCMHGRSTERGRAHLGAKCGALLLDRVQLA